MKGAEEKQRAKIRILSAGRNQLLLLEKRGRVSLHREETTKEGKGKKKKERRGSLPGPREE